jgi:hypothetical protein
MINDLTPLKPELDFALNRLNLSKSLELKAEAVSILESFDPAGLIRSLGLKKYQALLKRVGGETELESRISTLMLDGSSFGELIKKMEKAGVNVSNSIDPIFKSRKYSTLPKGTEIRIIRLSLSELGFDQRPHLFRYWQAAKKLGLKFCPPEAAAYQRLADMDQKAPNDYYMFVENGDPKKNKPYVFTLRSLGNEIRLLVENFVMSFRPHWEVDSDHIFLVPDKREKKGEE